MKYKPWELSEVFLWHMWRIVLENNNTHQYARGEYKYSCQRLASRSKEIDANQSLQMPRYIIDIF